ncbi:adenylyltransferase and sulfurtransferase MOCS3-like [Pomacea canaliculata]|uniref:adenylyltransferase and sulfurtransferase MOCS3-like n=1 Tax=Pomacea canaliculata TaxID=400727 RepID=UPI000D739C1C|nr:adenylyltransferase and sulfurtransferase MOCS3-like [Pomacea canaliculata]
MEVQALRQHILQKEQELLQMKLLLEEYEKNAEVPFQQSFENGRSSREVRKEPRKLSNFEIARYSRQLILPELGVKGQQLLSSCKVLIVGAGGLGCPAAVYLAAAGIGTLGVLDYDDVEMSNLHRQILHTEQRVGMAKAHSVATSCRNLNSSIRLIPIREQLKSENALSVIKEYDIILDATDNVATRYLLNDACVLAGKPLVSGSALRFEGQLTVYNYRGGPCYRCLYPKPPPPETVTNCSDGGVLGVVPGIIGCYQALEAIKIAADMGTTLNQRLLLFDALDCSTRIIKLRPRQASCAVCGDAPSIRHLIDYEQFCGARATDKDHEKRVLPPSSRITAVEYHELLMNTVPHVLIDVRMPVELNICCLPHPAQNVPMDLLQKDPKGTVQQIKCYAGELKHDPLSVIIVCRRGNDSQLAVNLLLEVDPDLNVKDIRGGLHAWARDVDLDFPVY